MCVVGIQSERVRTYLSSVAGTLFWSSVTAGERTGGSWQVCLSDQRVSHFAWETRGSLLLAWETSRYLPSVQNYRPYIVFSSPMRKYEHPLRPTYFSVYGWLSELTYFRVFFSLICWSYLRTEISVTLSIGNKLYYRHHILYFSFLRKPLCWFYLATTLNLLSSSTALCR